MSRRLGLVAAAALIGAVAVLAVLGSRSGSDGAAAAEAPLRLAWQGAPEVYEVPELPRDRILAGEIRNTSLEPAELSVDRVEVVDARGRKVKSSVRFLAAFAHGLYPPTQQVRDPGTLERTRLGEIAKLKPGSAIPMTLSWRVAPGGSPPVEVRFGGGSLPLPD